ncbi:MAG: FCD domain-containing protein [Mycobacterium sp.]
MTTAVERYLQEQISSGELAPGSQVPTERALATLLGRSRYDVRRQLGALESQGRVTREVGRGTFLTGSSAAPPGGAIRGPANLSPLDLIAARAAWEPNLMTLVAVAATTDDFTEIRRCLQAGEAAHTPEEFQLWDMAFHRALALAAHNAVVAALNDMVESGRRQLAGSGLDKRHHTIENRATCQVEHREIADAIFDRDPVRSQAAMRTHLQTVRRQLLPEVS